MLSGRQLGEAAHRLVINSLQTNVNHNDSSVSREPPRMYGRGAHDRMHPDDRRMKYPNPLLPRGGGYPNNHQDGMRPYSSGNHLSHDRDQFYPSSSGYHQPVRESHLHDTHQLSSNVAHGRNHQHWQADSAGPGPPHRYQQNSGGYHIPRGANPVSFPPVGGGSHAGYSGYEYQQRPREMYGSYQQRPPYRNSGNRGGLRNQPVNRFSGLDRSSRRPPPPGYE